MDERVSPAGHPLQVQAVVFDLDGVIADTEHLWDEGWTACAAAAGRPWTTTDSVRLQGMSSPEWSAALAAELGRPGDSAQVRAFVVGHILAALDDSELMPGARELLAHAVSRVPIALATSSSRPLIDKILEVHHLRHYFAATVSSEEVPRGKPSPDVYLEAVARLGVTGPVLGIEDSGAGMRAVHAAGLQLLAIPNHRYPPGQDALALADAVASDHAEALAQLRRLLP